MSAWRAGLSNARSAALRNDPTSISTALIACNHVSAASAKATSIIPVCVTHSRRMRLVRSTIAPENSGKIVIGTANDKPSNPSHSGEFVSW